MKHGLLKDQQNIDTLTPRVGILRLSCELDHSTEVNINYDKDGDIVETAIDSMLIMTRIVTLLMCVLMEILNLLLIQ